jgi:hypothetical protein
MDGRVLIDVGNHPDDPTTVMGSDIPELPKPLAQKRPDVELFIRGGDVGCRADEGENSWTSEYSRLEIAVLYSNFTVASSRLTTRQVVRRYWNA